MARWIVKYHRWLLAGVILAAGGSATLLVVSGLRHDYRLEAFVASNDSAYRTYRLFLDEFTSNEVAIIAVQTDEALSPGSTRIVRDLLDAVRPLPAVQRAQALADLPGWALKLVGHRLREHRLIRDNLLSRDGRTAAILLQMQGETQSPTDRRRTVARLREVVSAAATEHPDARMILAGPYVTLIDMYDYVDRDLLVFSIAAFALLGVTLWIVFRRPGPMLFALLTGVGATCCALGVAVVGDYPTSLITQMIVILVTILSVAACVHLAVAGEETAVLTADDRDATRRSRAMETLRHMAVPCTAVIATTAAGFGSVGISAITPVRIFGMLMVCGLVVALVAALAGSVWLTGGPRRTTSSPGRLSVVLTGSVRWALGHRLVVALIFIGAGLFAAGAIGRLRFESDFVKNFRPHSEVRTSYQFIESNLSPVGSMEIVVRTNDGGTILTPDNVAQARALGDAVVAKHEPIRKAMSLADLTTLAGPQLAATQADLDSRLTLARTIFGQDFQDNFLNADATALRLNLRAVEGVNVNDKLAMADDIGRMAREAFGTGFAVEVTGLYHFYAKLVSGLLRDQYRSFGLTVPAVFVALLVTFRSLRVAVVAMIANLLPVLFCLGTMGWLNIPVNMTTAMMLSVTLGIAVDDTIHYLWRCRREFRRTGDYAAALEATSASVGRACVFTTVVMAGGFWILLLSEFLPTAYFGGLVGFTMLGTLAADLILLPVLIRAFRVYGPTRMRIRFEAADGSIKE